MGDLRFREAERRWKDASTTANEAALLRERVRIGELTLERLHVAANCGHDGAAAALGTVVTSLDRNAETLLALLQPAGRGFVELVAIEAVRACSHAWIQAAQDSLLTDIVEMAVAASASPSDPRPPDVITSMGMRIVERSMRLFGTDQSGPAPSAALAGAALGWMTYRLRQPGFEFLHDASEACQRAVQADGLALIQGSRKVGDLAIHATNARWNQLTKR